MALRQGEIYWVSDCPPLHGRIAAPHAVVILNPTKQLVDPKQPIHAMVVSSSIPNPDPSHIPMPNKQANNPCTTCFDRPCWAVSGWILRIVDRSKLGSRCGYVTGATLAKLIGAFAQAVMDGRLPIDHPRAGGPFKPPVTK